MERRYPLADAPTAPAAGGVEGKPASAHPTPADDKDVFVENPYLRMLGFGARVGRLLGRVAAQGSRYVGYTSDVAESFRPVVDPNIVRLGYAVSWAYVGMDVTMAAKRAREADDPQWVRAGAHAAIFQSVATMGLPAFIIHTTVHKSDEMFKYFGRQSRWGPVVIGLAVIPALPSLLDHPCETAVDFVMDRAWPKTTTISAVNSQKHEKHE